MNGSGGDMDKVEDLKRVYAAAPADEPPAALDDLILAEARQAAESATPQGSGNERQGRWGPPLAAAAVLVLGVLVVFQMKEERPALESAGVVSPEKRSEDTIALAPVPQGDMATGIAPPAARKAQQPVTGTDGAAPFVPQRSEPSIVADATDTANAAREARSETAQAAMLTGRDRPSDRPERPMAPRSLASAAAPALPSTELAMRKADETPEAWLRRLADLKQKGRTKEFDEGLAEFRKRHPDYRIPEALLAPR